jgi:hypothetical protein
MRTAIILITFFIAGKAVIAQEDRGYKVYQFPANMIPRIDGKTDDWESFPKE